MTDSTVRIVLMTAPDQDTGRAIARTLVEQRLAACGNVIPTVESVFRWEGQVSTETEALVILKTSKERVESMMERAAALHPYEVPELLSLPVKEAWVSYADWVITETRDEPEA